MENMYEKALELVKSAHSGQTDKAGKPYLNHLLAVAGCFTTETEKTIALLHDIVEDTDYTLNDLTNIGFPEFVVQTVDCLTKRENEAYADYLGRIKYHNCATDIKLADLKHNMDKSRLTEVTEKDLERLAKYELAVKYLEWEERFLWYGDYDTTEKCVVIVEDWQIQCCYNPFAVDKYVHWIAEKWGNDRADSRYTDMGITQVDYIYEEHEEEWKELYKLRGKITRIQVLFRIYAAVEGSKELIEVESHSKELTSASNFEKYEDEDNVSYVGYSYIVHLEDVRVAPAGKGDIHHNKWIEGFLSGNKTMSFNYPADGRFRMDNECEQMRE